MENDVYILMESGSWPFVNKARGPNGTTAQAPGYTTPMIEMAKLLAQQQNVKVTIVTTLTLKPQPSCILSDKYMLRSADTVAKYKIPRIVFDGMSCFKQLCTHHLYASVMLYEIPDSEPFVLSGLPDRIEITKDQLPHEFNHSFEGNRVKSLRNGD
ncbi:UDP-glucuronosyl/UDP-glucosyltransferase [Artemisia annua]|uniref:UDP-glucuronosyl/UDP-glucosyltransferase n=1 Tax=Artemisia annua TaxID=35608 RepID=A0A2U1P7N4_ARTAN|nr:UDP-glucuronosyl/UDP-glucosyltransferase [Artemisia annua]